MKSTTSMCGQFARVGRGEVPPEVGLTAASKKLGEAIVDAGLQAHHDLPMQLDFTSEGSSAQDVRDFFAALLGVAGAKEPLVQSGGIYGVTTPDGNTFHDMNGTLLVHQLQNSSLYRSLTSKEDQKRAAAIFEIVFSNTELRNRNPLHPSVVDSCVIGNLLNFPKHIFGFPYACYGTDGNEALSMTLFSYREQRQCKNPTILYVGSENEALLDIRCCVERLGMKLKVVTAEQLGSFQDHGCVVATMTSLDSDTLGDAACWSEARQLGLHVHVSDVQWRGIFTSSAQPTHFELPTGVTSVTIEEGLMECGYSLYRDNATRDGHLDVPSLWQTVYIAPNEGGSGAGRPLLMDLCTFLLGWTAIGDIARHKPLVHRSQYTLEPITLEPNRSPAVYQTGYDNIVQWAKKHLDTTPLEKGEALSRAELESRLITFQQEFIGGKGQPIEAMTSAGGTRSINLAFEAVVTRARKHGTTMPLKVLTGNPHLAVERAERRFGFQLVRLEKDGRLCLDKFKEAISDPAVAAVYVQTLSFTDGITDPLPEVLEIMEAENKRRDGLPVMLINDSCLAFNVLVHNDGKDGKPSMRLLDLSVNHVTPTIVINDAHKHLGTDKGLSTIAGTKGSLTILKGCRRVGFQPQHEDLIRAMANLQFVGASAYYDLYRSLSTAIERTVSKLEAAGMKCIHGHNRIKGSTVMAFEDPSGAVAIALKKKGYSAGTIYNVSPEHPERCQTGWQLSMTPHQLRPMGPSQRPALDHFSDDCIAADRAVKASFSHKLSRALFSENTFPAHLISGNIEPWIFSLLSGGGLGKPFAVMAVRRFCTAQLDSGVICVRPHEHPLKNVSKKVVAFLFLLFLIRRTNSF